jgi:lipopolysaccharide/colanic/teichoic acid biosynthesis glycosyltransferase
MMIPRINLLQEKGSYNSQEPAFCAAHRRFNIRYSKLKNKPNHGFNHSLRYRRKLITEQKNDSGNTFKCFLSKESQKILKKALVDYDFKNKKPVQYAMKRVLDVLVASVGMVFSLPVMAAAMAAIRAESKGAPVFYQKRIGKMGKKFKLYKLRTMNGKNNELTKLGKLLKKWKPKPTDDPRITVIGAWLRKFSVDELPQLWNVLKGDMSAIGYRPFSQKYAQVVEKYDVNSSIRYSQKPGLKLPYKSFKGIDIGDVIKTEKEHFQNWNISKDIKALLVLTKEVVTGRNR